MDRIFIKKLEVFAHHGVLPEENALGQKFVVSAALYADLRNAGKSDNLAETLDYGRICVDIKKYVEDNAFKLIETVAEGLAARLLASNPSLRRVRLEVEKPWAPVALHLEAISVEIERGRHTAFIALGSNLGDREAYLRFAVDELGKAEGCRVSKVSEFINTAPYGDIEQDDFLNGCLELDTLLTETELLDLLHDVEDRAGRVREARWGPRTLDLDVIFYDDVILSCDTLRIPHIDMHNRVFVLEPLAEIAPSMLHPVLMKTVSELLANQRTSDGDCGAGEGATANGNNRDS